MSSMVLNVQQSAGTLQTNVGSICIVGLVPSRGTVFEDQIIMKIVESVTRPLL